MPRSCEKSLCQLCKRSPTRLSKKAYVGKLEAFSKELTEGTLSTTRALRRARELEEEFHKVFGHSHEVNICRSRSHKQPRQTADDKHSYKG